MKSNLKIAGILNIIFSAISFILTFFNYSFVSFISGFLSFGFLLASGVIFLNLSNLSEKELYYKKDLIIVLGAILVMFNLISALLVLISSSKLTSYQNNITNDNYLETPIKPKIDKETRRIDILLKLGTAMVLISGIIFSTTTWHSISAGFKVFFLIIGSILLFALSKFTEKKLQLTKSSFVYFLLGSSFLVFAFLSIGYFNLFGPYFCMKGHLSDLYFSSLFAIIMIISAIIYHKYNYKTFIIIGLFSLLLSVIYFFLSFNIKEGIVTIIILSFLLISNLFIKEEQKTLKTFITILIITMGFIFIPYLLTLENPYILVANSILLIANLAVILFKDQKISTRILSIILINLIIPFTIIYLNIRYGATMVFIVGILSILYILSTFTKLLENKALNIAYQITYNTIIIYTLLISLFAKAEDLFFIAFIVMLTNIIFNLKTKNKTIEYYISPLKVSIMVLFTLPYISDNFFYINTPVTLTILFIVYAVLNVLIKNTGLKITYYILFFITLITTTIYNITYQDMLITIATFLGFIALYLFTYTNDKFGKFVRIPSLVLLELSLFNTLTILNSNTSINPIVPSIITLIIYVIISIIYRKDKKILIPTAILTIIPIIDITYDLSNNIYNMSYIVDIIGTSYLLYLMILIRKLLITKDINKTIFTTVATILILLLNIFNKNLITGTFIGIISLALIIIGLVKKEYKSLFIVGVIFTIVNIIHKITIISGEFLFWLYLLIAGIALITIVSIKEIKKQKEDKNTNINNM